MISLPQGIQFPFYPQKAKYVFFFCPFLLKGVIVAVFSDIVQYY